MYMYIYVCRKTPAYIYIYVCVFVSVYVFMRICDEKENQKNDKKDD